MKTTKATKKQVNKHDARKLPHEVQMVNKVSALLTIMNTEHVANLDELKDRHLSKGTLTKIMNTHKVTAQTVYRWIRDYHTNGGLSLARKGRPQLAHN